MFLVTLQVLMLFISLWPAVGVAVDMVGLAPDPPAMADRLRVAEEAASGIKAEMASLKDNLGRVFACMQELKETCALLVPGEDLSCSSADDAAASGAELGSEQLP